MAYLLMNPYIAGSVSAPIYGAKWLGTSDPSWIRTDAAAQFSDPNPYYAGMSDTPSSPFDTISPWKDIVRDTSDSNAGTLVKIPKYYYKWTRTGDEMLLQISATRQTGFFVSPAHADRGDGSGERDWVYVGAYHCAESTYKSTTGVLPQVYMTRAEFRTAIHNLGSKIWQIDFAMLWTIRMLYLVEYANWNSQAVIGGGGSETTETSPSIYNMGSTDSMPYHTGTVSNSHSAYGACRYRYIEGLWNNCYDWCDGIYFAGTDNKDVYAIKNPANFSDTTGGTKVGERPITADFISKLSAPSVSGFEYALYPTEVSGSDSTYLCDKCSYNANGIVAHSGSPAGQSQNYGLFFFGGSSGEQASFGNIGSRLMKLP